MTLTHSASSKYLTPDQYAAVARYVREEAAHREDPAANAAPNPKALEVWPAGSRVKSVKLVRRGPWGETLMAVRFHHRMARHPRHVTPSLWAAILIGIAFGMPFGLHDNGKGFLYPRFRTAGREGSAVFLLRLVCDAKPGETVKQRTAQGIPTDYHYLTPETLSVVEADEIRAEGKLSRTPERGRGDFFAFAKKYFLGNQPRTGIAISLEEYLALSLLAFSHSDPKD